MIDSLPLRLAKAAAMQVARHGECFILLDEMKIVPLELTPPIDLDEELLDGTSIVHGIEFDNLGRPVAYHFPKEAHWRAYRRVEASKVLHWVLMLQPGQIRGIPIDDYDKVEKAA